MNPKTRIKVIIDIAMTVLFLILMNLALTGVLMHEVIGVGILGLFAAHLAVNKQWIKSVASNFAGKIGFKAKAMFVLNAVLSLTMLSTIVSGVLISQYLFPALAASNITFWFNVHAVSSWLTLLVLVAHTLVHRSWIANIIKRLVPTGGLRVLVARTSLVLFATAAIYSFINNSTIDLVLPSSSSSQASGSNIQKVSATNVTSGTTAVAIQETLQEYLSKFYCSACGKHCPLSSPHCARGRSQVQSATATYNASLSAGITYEL